MALAGLLVFVAGLCLGPVEETDLFFRMAAGEQFLRSGHLVHRNLFSFTFPDAPYLDSAWLFDVAATALFRLGGFPAVVLAKTALVLLLALLAYRLCRRRGAGPVVASLVLALAFFCMRERLVERPHLFSLLGELAVLAFLPLVETGDRRVWHLIALVALWANFHAGAFLAPVVLGLAGAGVLLDRAPPRAGLRFGLAALLAAGALLATPVGIGIFRYLAFHVGIFDVHPVDEFRSLTWRSDAPFILFALGSLGVLAISRHGCWKERLPALGLTLLAAWHVRFTADALLIAAVVAAPALEHLAGLFLTRRPRALAAGLLAALSFAALGPRIAEASRGGHFAAIGLDESALPLAAIRFVEAHGLRERMYNDFETGAYLLWQGFPRYRVFVDPRLPAYPVNFHGLLGRLDVTRDEWTRAMSELGVTSALLDYAGINRRAALWDPERWALIFRAKNSRVFVRRLEKWKDLIAAFEIPATFDFTVENGATTLPLSAPPAESPVPACEWQVRLGDLYFDLDGDKGARATVAYRAALAAPAGCLGREHELAASAWVGSLDVSAGRFEQALPLLDRALAVSPTDTAALTNRALALSGLGRATEAREVWGRIATLAAGTELGRRAAERATAGK
jgi:tetratricopeptide (TPR) repeat protein